MNLQGPVSAIMISSCLGREELSGEDSGGGSGSGNDEDGWGGGEESQLKPNFESIFKGQVVINFLWENLSFTYGEVTVLVCSVKGHCLGLEMLGPIHASM